jgi:CubicO group peptidase (beta-lactamase class C family)
MLAIFESGRPILDDVVKADVASLRQLYGDKAFSASFLALRVREAGTFYDILVEESLDGLTTGLHTPEGSEAAFELDTFSVVSPSELLTDAETSASQPTGAHFQSLVVQTLPSRSIATQQSTNQNISALRAARGHPLQMPVNPRPWLMTEQKLAEGIDAILITSQIPAIGVVALTPRGECSLLRGVRKFNDPTPANEDDKFLMARLTSVMTSILLARMVDEGLLNWETTLLEALPEWEGIIHPGNHLTTMAWLVGGMCGWEVNLREAEDGLLWEHIKTPGIGAREARVAVLQSYLGRPPTKSPGQGPSVWNEAYIMCIAAILETMLDCSWEELMQTKLFDPLGMTLSGFGPPERLIESATGSGTPTQPWPHNHQVQNASDSPVPSIPQRNSNEGGFYLTTAFRPIYGVYSTLRDMTNFGRFCQRESIATTDALAPNSSASSQPIPSGSLRLSDRSREIIFGIQNPSYENIMKVSSSLGWTKGDYLLQGVSMDGWCSRMIVAPRAGTVLIAFTNVGKKTPYDALNATFKLACRF